MNTHFLVLAADAEPKAVILVEGISDQIAVDALAECRGRNLRADGVAVVPIGGAQAIERFLNLFGPRGLDLTLAGLCDAGEERHFARALERAGLAANIGRPELETLGFFVCEPDLEAELIRANGADAVQEVAATHGDLEAFRTLQKQPEWRERPVEEQLRRWLGSGGRRKTRYARYLVEALEPSRVPRPLQRVLERV